MLAVSSAVSEEAILSAVIVNAALAALIPCITLDGIPMKVLLKALKLLLLLLLHPCFAQ